LHFPANYRATHITNNYTQQTFTVGCAIAWLNALTGADIV
jgi:hypothetical protein